MSILTKLQDAGWLPKPVPATHCGWCKDPIEGKAYKGRWCAEPCYLNDMNTY